MKKITSLNGRDIVEKLYIFTNLFLIQSWKEIAPILRRIQRFIALPYVYIFWTDWKSCTRSPLLVAIDFLYIFFILRSFPDNYTPCKLWEKPKDEWHYYYGSNYNPYQRKALRKDVQIKEYEIVYEDKRICEDVCRAHGIPLPSYYGIIDIGSDMVEFLQSCNLNSGIKKRFIVKPMNGKGGHSILVFESNNGHIYNYYGGKFTICDKLVADQAYIVQEFVIQDEHLSNISPSTNTVRIVTGLERSNNVLIIGAYMRFGSGATLIDNLSAGGLAVAIDLVTGRLSKTGVDRNGTEYLKHPSSNHVFERTEVPKWVEVCQLAKKIQSSISYHKLLGMDIAITKSGPVLIEINSIYDNIDLEQVCGPILKDKSVYEFYKSHNLLISKPQKNLVFFSTLKSHSAKAENQPESS